jgi:pilus assembly protein CpaF
MTVRALGFGKRQIATSVATLSSAVQSGETSPVNELTQRISRSLNGDPSWQLYDKVLPKLDSALERAVAKTSPRGVLAKILGELCNEAISENSLIASEDDIRNAITRLLNDWVAKLGGLDAPIAPPEAVAESKPEPTKKKSTNSSKTVQDAKAQIFPLLIEHVDASAMVELTRGELAEQIAEIVDELLRQEKMHLNSSEQRDLITLLLNDMLGLGPLEPLLADDSINDIMINGPNTIYVERKGKLELTDVRFRDNMHLLNIAQRIVSAVGRRVDESSPICDARLLDGSRVNVIIPPLAIDGTSISIRKFSRSKITLEAMAQHGNITEKMCRLLQIAGRIRLNIIISGGTGSGKTTMLNAISRCIDPGERVVTIEDAAELQLQQTHVVRLETRPANLEGNGEVSMRDLVKNALRMRPDRIILGEVRGPEAVDLLAAMNTGHDGSLGTLHANRPREAITRLENMVNMAGLNLPPKAIRTQIADAVHLIIQVSRMRDGVRRITHITEVVGMESDVVVTQDLYLYKYNGEDESGILRGEHESTGLRPKFYDRAEYYGLGRALMECM